MIFLKRIEAYGFKSFGEPINISFEHGMIGVVGPNGSGKSNITDAIRWTLGEQSLKSLRGSSSEDVIFNGSENKQGLNMAEVKLVFDNSNRIFDMDYEEVEVVRRLFRGSGENEYYINKQRVRLKDVQDFAFDTGLTRSSLAIISQGNISNFAEAKPIDRRSLFEEAAGVSKYKKRKLESMRKLERTNENLERLKDLIGEIERKLPTLRRQREKALKYKAKKEELNEIEIAILIKDIKFFSDKLEEIKTQKATLDNEKTSVNRELNSKTEEFNELNNSNYQLDLQISKLSKEFEVVVNEISGLKIQKIELDNKRQSDRESEGRNTEAQKLADKFNDLQQQQTTANNKINTTKEKIAENTAQQEAFRTQQSTLEQALAIKNRNTIRWETEIERLKSAIDNREGLFEGVKTILQNRNVLPGIIGMIQDVIKFDEKFELPLAIALGAHAQDIIVDNPEHAKRSINFLKENQAGQATFLPLTTISAKYLKEDEIYLARSVPGFLGIASELVTCDTTHQIAIDYLLSRFLICDTYDAAVQTSEMVQKKYSVISLEGEIIRPQGAITGGSRKQKSIINNYEQELATLEDKLVNDTADLEKIERALVQLKHKINQTAEVMNSQQSYVGSLTLQLENMAQDINRLDAEYRLLTGQSLVDQTGESTGKPEDFIGQQINDYELKKSDLEQRLTSTRAIKERQMEKANELNTYIQEKRHYISLLSEKVAKLNTDLAMAQEKINQDLIRLSDEYHMTYEYASTTELKPITDETAVRERIKQLRSDLSEIGNVNMDAIEEYVTENERFEFMSQEFNQLNESANNLLHAIDEMDQIMEKQFTAMIRDVNKALPETFKVLFGGGGSKIEFTDPENMLETGIDIRVSPPGKNITNLNLLSGGEKSLVALSVLFAILKVRPLPLVVLDEVEAPLDVANVERFAKYIKDFTQTTQFVVVTHRMGTMEYCDVLYGTTMQQKGITKIVGIKLLEAQEMIEQIEKEATETPA